MFIKLTRIEITSADGEDSTEFPIWVRADEIVTIETSNYGYTWIITSMGGHQIKETPEDVLKLCEPNIYFPGGGASKMRLLNEEEE